MVGLQHNCQSSSKYQVSDTSTVSDT